MLTKKLMLSILLCVNQVVSHQSEFDSMQTFNLFIVMHQLPVHVSYFADPSDAHIKTPFDTFLMSKQFFILIRHINLWWSFGSDTITWKILFSSCSISRIIFVSIKRCKYFIINLDHINLYRSVIPTIIYPAPCLSLTEQECYEIQKKSLPIYI